MASAGDVNADGYGDVIIGAPAAGSAPDPSGKAYVYHGSATGLSNVPNGGTGPSFVPDWEIYGPTTPVAALLGESVNGAGDVNGDGYSDVIVGA